MQVLCGGGCIQTPSWGSLQRTGPLPGLPRSQSPPSLAVSLPTWPREDVCAEKGQNSWLCSMAVAPACPGAFSWFLGRSLMREALRTSLKPVRCSAGPGYVQIQPEHLEGVGILSQFLAVLVPWATFLWGLLFRQVSVGVGAWEKC